MRVRATARKVSPSDAAELGIDTSYNSEWHLTLGYEYIVYAIRCFPGSAIYGSSTLYQIVDDGDAFISAPACLFEITDGRASSHWRVACGNEGLDIKPEEFFRNPFLSEEILDREPAAIEIFRQISCKLKSE